MRNDTEDRGRVADSHRVGGEIFCDDEASADGNAITQGDTFKNDRTSPKELVGSKKLELGYGLKFLRNHTRIQRASICTALPVESCRQG